MGRGPTPGARAVAVVSIAAAFALGIARDASAQSCDAGVFASKSQAPAGGSVRITRSTPILDPGGTDWALQVCFVLSQHGPAPAPVSATHRPATAGAGRSLLPARRRAAALGRRAAVGLPGPARRAPPHTRRAPGRCPRTRSPRSAACSRTTRPRPPASCFRTSPTRCTSRSTRRETPCTSLPSRSPTSREEAPAAGSSGGCGLTGIEFLGIPLALLAMRARSGRRVGGRS